MPVLAINATFLPFTADSGDNFPIFIRPAIRGDVFAGAITVVRTVSLGLSALRGD